MATLNELTYNLLNISKGGRVSDDEPISLKQVAFWVGYYRAWLLRQDYEKKRTINPDAVQSLGCVPVQLVDKAECCEIETKCYILRTIDKIPKPIEFYMRNGLEFVGTIDRAKSFQLMSPYRSNWKKYHKYTADIESAYQLNGYIYVTSNTVLEYINIQGIFEDPTEAQRYNTCENGQPCFSYDDEYPLATHFIPSLVDLITKRELGITTMSPEDTKNNAKDDVNATNASQGNQG